MSAVHDASGALDDTQRGSSRVGPLSMPLGRASMLPPAPLEVLPEPGRMAAVRRYMPDPGSLPDVALDRLTRLAGDLLHMPIVVLSLLSANRQEVVSCVGLQEPYASSRVVPLTHSICQYTVASGAPLVIKDTRRHPWVRASRAVHELGVVSYAGIPIVVQGQIVGTLCAVGQSVHAWTQDELRILNDMAAVASDLLEQRAHHDTVAALLEVQREMGELLAAPSPDSHDTFRRMLCCVGERLGWDVMHLWFPEDDGAVLRPVQVWNAPYMNMRVFDERLRSVRLRPGESIAGTAYATRSPFWSADLSGIGHNTRGLFTPIVGVESGFGFPAIVDDEVVAIVSCFSREHRDEDATLVQFSLALGQSIATVCLRERAATALAASRARERSLMDASTEAIVMMGADSVVREWSAGAERMFGYRREQAIGRKLYHLVIPPHLRAKHLTAMARYLETGEARVQRPRRTVTGQRADGTQIAVDMAVMRVPQPQDGPPLFIAVLRAPEPQSAGDDVNAAWPELGPLPPVM